MFTVQVHETLPGSYSYPKVTELQTRRFESSNFRCAINARIMSPQYSFQSLYLHIMNNMSFMKTKFTYRPFHTKT